MDIQKTLLEYDFTKNEAAIYVCLLKLGLTNVGPIAKQSGLHRQVVYEALHALKSKGLITSVMKNNRKHFQAASPDAIIKQLEEKREMANELVAGLQALQSVQSDRLEVTTLYGQTGFIENLKDMVESTKRTDGIMRIIGGAPDSLYYRAIGKKLNEYTELSRKSGIKKYLISPDEYSDEFKTKFVKEKLNTLKTMSTGLSSPTYTRITPEMISIEIYSEASEMTVIQIRNAAIARGYLDHFELLWQQAKLFSGNA